MKGNLAAMLVHSEPFEFREYEVPEVGDDDIIVKISTTNICGSDVHLWHGRGLKLPELPVVLGHEAVGIVHAVGKNVSGDSYGDSLVEGDRVVYSYFSHCGACPTCVNGETACPNRARFWLQNSCDKHPYFRGTFGEYQYLKRGHWIFKAPEGLADELLSPVNCVFAQALMGLHTVGVDLGDTVVVQGVGGLGLYCCMFAKERGVDQVIAIDRFNDRLALAREFGADYTLNVDETESSERLEAVKDWTNGTGADVLVEVAGTPLVVPEGIQMMRPHGRYLLMGNITPGLTAEVDTGLVIRGMQTLQAAISYDQWVIPRVLRFLERVKDRYPFEKIISHRFPFEQINEAMVFADQGKAIRVMVTM